MSLIAIVSAFVVELVFGIISNSLGLVTDSIHALLDSVVTAILLIAAKMAIRPPDEEHTYGHGKIESLGGLIGGIAIFLISIFFIYESIMRLQSPKPEHIPEIMGLVGGIYTIGVDVFRIVLLRKSIEKIGGSTLKADFYHAFMDLGSTIIAIVGIVLVSIGIYSGDFFAALILGILLAALSVKLVHKTAMDLTDIISPDLVSEVRDIAKKTVGVIDVGSVLMRRSGDKIFAEVTIFLRGDSSFDEAHEISTQVERNIKDKLTNSIPTIHFEPVWDNIPKNSKIFDIARSVEGVREVHNIGTHKRKGKVLVSLHVMVDREINLYSAHKISEEIEKKIQENLPEVEHVTIHLEPYLAIPEKDIIEDPVTDEKIKKILLNYPEIKKIGRILTLNFEGILKIDIDCSFDKDLSIELIHELTSQIEKEVKSRFRNSIITIHPEPM